MFHLQESLRFVREMAIMKNRRRFFISSTPKPTDGAVFEEFLFVS